MCLLCQLNESPFTGTHFPTPPNPSHGGRPRFPSLDPSRPCCSPPFGGPYGCLRAHLILQLNEKHPVQELRQCGLLLGISAPKPAQRVGNFNIRGPRRAVGDFLLGYARSSIATSHSSSIPAHRSQLQSTRLPFLPASLLYFNLCDLKEKREREKKKKNPQEIQGTYCFYGPHEFYDRAGRLWIRCLYYSGFYSE